MTAAMAMLAGSKSRRRHLWLLLTSTLALSHFGSFDFSNQAIVTDVRYFLYFSSQVVKGAVPHLDFFGNKTQLATFAGALFYELGRTFGAEPLMAIRFGYLGLASVVGVLVFEVHRRLADRRDAAGVLALLVYLGFPLLGVMPSIGNVPKMLVVLFALISSLLVHSERWILAGVAGALAFLDWQIGALVICGVTGATLVDRNARVRSICKVVFGLVVGALPFLSYYLLNGALGPTYRQTIQATLARGAFGITRRNVEERLGHLVEVIGQGCDGHEWLVVVGMAGLIIYPLWIYHYKSPSVLRLMLVLGIYHYGIVAFCFVDFQRYGDLFVLLHSLAFFGGVTIVELYRRIQNSIEGEPGQSNPNRKRIVRAAQVVILLAFGIAVRPSKLSPEFTLRTKIGAAGLTLQDQKEVSAELGRLIQGRNIAFASSSEQLFLTDRTNGLPFIYWNPASYAHYRLDPEEGRKESLLRILEQVNADVVISRFGAGPGYRRIKLKSASGAYSIDVYLRKGMSQRGVGHSNGP